MLENNRLSITTAKNNYLKLHKTMESIAENAPLHQVDDLYGEAFGKIFDDAVNGDVVSQDYLGWIFKRGKKNLVPENIDLSMKWQLLSAANGNEYTIERLSIFLNSAYDQIMSLHDFEQICQTFSISRSNYQYIIGRLICEAICDELNISETNIITDIPTTLEYNSSTMYKFNQAKSKAVQSVINYFRKVNAPSQPSETTQEQSQPHPLKSNHKSFFSKIFKK